MYIFFLTLMLYKVDYFCFENLGNLEIARLQFPAHSEWEYVNNSSAKTTTPVSNLF